MEDPWMLVKVLLPSTLVFLWLLRELVNTRQALRDAEEDVDDDLR